jgi:hypothetical protein
VGIYFRLPVVKLKRPSVKSKIPPAEVKQGRVGLEVPVVRVRGGGCTVESGG